jgi:septal ring factor EnvC (AmiA/AmiB activator)
MTENREQWEHDIRRVHRQAKEAAQLKAALEKELKENNELLTIVKEKFLH